MKRLLFVSGPMGCGKTSVCRRLLHRLAPAVYLDGDWCWMMEPFTVTEETRALVQRNICFQLNQFLRCSAFDTVIFCWVMHRQSIVDGLLAGLDAPPFAFTHVSLTPQPQVLARRVQADVDAGLRQEDAVARSLSYLPLYHELSSLKLDNSLLDVEETAAAIQALLRPARP